MTRSGRGAAASCSSQGVARFPRRPLFPSPSEPTGGEPCRIRRAEGKPAAGIRAQEHSHRGLAYLAVDAMTPLERSEEVPEGACRFRDACSPAAPQEPRRLGLRGPELRRKARDLPQRHLPLEGLLDVAPPQRRLPRMDALQDERLGEIPAVGELEQPRPEVVVLALDKGRVVTKAVVVEQLAVDEHGRMEERGAEEGEKPNRSGPDRVAVQRPGPSPRRRDRGCRRRGRRGPEPRRSS